MKLEVIGNSMIALRLGVDHWSCLTKGFRDDIDRLLKEQIAADQVVVDKLEAENKAFEVINEQLMLQLQTVLQDTVRECVKMANLFDYEYPVFQKIYKTAGLADAIKSRFIEEA